MLKLVNFFKDTKAAAAVEFILVFPIFLTMWAGLTEVTNMMAVQIKTNNMAYVIANLASTYTSGDPTMVHPMTGENYDPRSRFEELPLVSEKLAGGFERSDGGGNGVFIAAYNKCPGQAGLTQVFVVTNGAPDADVAGTLPPTTINEGEGIYYIAVRQQYDSIIGGALINFGIDPTRSNHYIVKPRTAGLVLDFTGSDNCS